MNFQALLHCKIADIDAEQEYIVYNTDSYIYNINSYTISGKISIILVSWGAARLFCTAWAKLKSGQRFIVLPKREYIKKYIYTKRYKRVRECTSNIHI